MELDHEALRIHENGTVHVLVPDAEADPSTLRHYIQQLIGSGNRDALSLASWMLMKAPCPWTSMLIHLLGVDPHRAADSLQWRRDPVSVDALIEFIRAAFDPPERVFDLKLAREAAMEALAHIGGADLRTPGFGHQFRGDLRRKIAPVLIEAVLRHPAHPGVAASQIGELRDPRTVPLLIKLLDGADEPARIAATALGHQRDTRAVPALLKCLNHPDLELRCAAAWSLGEIADPRAILALADASRSEHEDLRASATQGLAEIAHACHDGSCLEPLIERLTDPAKIRRHAAWGLVALPSEEARCALFDALYDTSPDGDQFISFADPRSANEAVQMAIDALNKLGSESTSE